MRSRAPSAGALGGRARLASFAGAFAVLAPLAALTGAPVADAAITLPPGHAKDVAVQSDGKVIVGFDASDGRFMLVRLGAGGAPDPTFGGGDGIVETVPDPAWAGLVTDIALQPDGRILAAGTAWQDQATTGFAVVRYRADGSLDPTFGGDGTVITQFGGGGHAVDPSIAVVPGGGVVAVGSPIATPGLPVARYRPDGALDTSFDGDGKATIDLPGSSDRANGVAVDSAGNAVFVGSAHLSSGRDEFVARVGPNGQLDQGFGSGGIVIWNSGNDNLARDVAIQADGRIVTAGQHDYESRVTVSRYLSNGQPDPSFGDGGHVLAHPLHNPLGEAGTDLALLADGRIAVSGTSDYPDLDIVVTVYTAGGALDPAFDGDDGVLQFDLGVPPGQDHGGFIAVARNGSLVIAGTHSTSAGGPGQLAVTAVPTLAPRADVSVTMAATPNPAPAGPVELLAVVRNDGPTAAGVVTLLLETSHATGPPRVSQGSCTSPQPGTTDCVLGPIAPGGEARVAVDIVVTAFEEGVFGTATVGSSSFDPDLTDNVADIEVVIIGTDPTE